MIKQTVCSGGLIFAVQSKGKLILRIDTQENVAAKEKLMSQDFIQTYKKFP